MPLSPGIIEYHVNVSHTVRIIPDTPNVTGNPTTIATGTFTADEAVNTNVIINYVLTDDLANNYLGSVTMLSGTSTIGYSTSVTSGAINASISINSFTPSSNGDQNYST